MKYTFEDIRDVIYLYNSKFPEFQNEVTPRKKRFGKIYFGGIFGSVSPSIDAVAPDEKTFTASNKSNYGLYALIPNYGKNRHVFFKIGFQNSEYDIAVKYQGNDYNFHRTITSYTAGMRYAFMRGFFRPYFGWNLSYTIQKVNSVTYNDRFPIILDFGGIIPINKVSITLNCSYLPIIYMEQGYKMFNYGIGIMF